MSAPGERCVNRRQFVKLALFGGGLVAVAPLVQACGTAAPAAPTAAPAATKAPAAAATTAPAAAATKAPATGTKAKLSIWTQQGFTAAADEKLGDLFRSFGKDNNVDIDFQIIAYTALVEKLAASIEGGNPPDICFLFDNETAYHRGKGNLVDITDIMEPLSKQGGGFFNGATQLASHKGKFYSAPMAMNPWPIHARQDLMDAAGVKEFPKTWVELGQLAKQLQKPPQLYGLGMAVGRSGGDTEDHFVAVLWEMGGKVQNDDGTLSWEVEPVAKTLAQFKKWYSEDKVIPPGSINWDDTGNNKGYQSEQLVFTSNPSSVMAWLVENKPDLAQKTKLYPTPGRNLIDGWLFGIFNKSKFIPEAKACLQYVMQPARYKDFIIAVNGRWLPVYQDIAKDKLWNEGIYAEYNKLAQTGSLLAYSGGGSAGLGEAMDTYVMPDMLAAVLKENVDPQKAAEDSRKRLETIWAKYKD